MLLALPDPVSLLDMLAALINTLKCMNQAVSSRPLYTEVQVFIPGEFGAVCCGQRVSETDCYASTLLYPHPNNQFLFHWTDFHEI
jgi:hypothetical protein